jgi:hypothetical protein
MVNPHGEPHRSFCRTSFCYPAIENNFVVHHFVNLFLFSAPPEASPYPTSSKGWKELFLAVTFKFFLLFTV